MEFTNKRSFEDMEVKSHEEEEFDSSIPRSGKWSAEEEAFANKLIVKFEAGTLIDCCEGSTLRSYLAKKLNCAPMRISKKFAGQCIGKHTFVKKENRDASTDLESCSISSVSGATNSDLDSDAGSTKIIPNMSFDTFTKFQRFYMELDLPQATPQPAVPIFFTDETLAVVKACTGGAVDQVNKRPRYEQQQGCAESGVGLDIDDMYSSTKQTVLNVTAQFPGQQSAGAAVTPEPASTNISSASSTSSTSTSKSTCSVDAAAASEVGRITPPVMAMPPMHYPYGNPCMWAAAPVYYPHAHPQMYFPMPVQSTGFPVRRENGVCVPPPISVAQPITPAASAIVTPTASATSTTAALCPQPLQEVPKEKQLSSSCAVIESDEWCDVLSYFCEPSASSSGVVEEFAVPAAECEDLVVAPASIPCPIIDFNLERSESFTSLAL